MLENSIPGERSVFKFFKSFRRELWYFENRFSFKKLKRHKFCSILRFNYFISNWIEIEAIVKQGGNF